MTNYADLAKEHLTEWMNNPYVDEYVKQSLFMIITGPEDAFEKSWKNMAAQTAKEHMAVT